MNIFESQKILALGYKTPQDFGKKAKCWKHRTELGHVGRPFNNIIVMVVNGLC